MTGRKTGPRKVLVVLATLLVCLVLSCCCIEVGSDQAGTPSSAPQQATVAQTPAQPAPPFMPGAPGVLAAHPIAPVTPSPVATPAGTVVYAEPIPPTVAANFSFRKIPTPPDSFPLPFNYPTAPFFSGTYNLEWNNVALLAQPSDPPFVIEMGFVAGTQNPYDARAIVTVRNNLTGEVIAEDGYNGEYNSEKEKRICIREIGDYHINIYGYRTTVYLVLREGVEEGKAVPYGIFEKTVEPQYTGEEFFEEEYYG